MSRGILFVAFAAVCVGGAAVYVWQRAVPRGGERGGSGPTPVVAQAETLDGIRSGPHVYFRSVRPDEFGRVVVAALEAPNERRVSTPLSCDRVDFGRSRGICLADTRGPLGPSAEARIVTRDFDVVGSVTLPGVPIRARLSPDERYAAATVFVTGERYDSDFTTRTAIIDTSTGQSLGDLEQFDTERDGRPFRRVDFNFWGVTFTSDSRRFYATLGTGGTRYLVEGDLPTRRLRVVREQVECPSLSPDGQTIGFKSRVPGTREWRIHTLQLSAGLERAVAGETRNIDDQVEWLDDGHLLYQFVAERGVPEDAMNVWVASARDGDAGPPAIFIRAANSPAVVR